MKILVTGGAGFMGSWLVDELLKRGHDVTSVDDLSGGFMRNVNPKCKFIKMDVRNKKGVDKIVKGVDVIFHLAAYAAEGQSVFSPIEINDINITPMNNLLVAAVNNNVKRFVFTSSMAVYGDQKTPFDESMIPRPEDPYGISKYYCEMMLKTFAETFDFEFVVIRPHNVYGPRQNIADPFRNVLGIWINRIMNNKPPIIYGDGHQTRAFSFIEDVTPAIANAGFYDKCVNQVINVGSEEVTSINEACKIVLESIGSDFEPMYEPARPREVKHAFCTIEKSQKLLDYKTKNNLKKGVKKMVEWAKEIGPQKPSYRIPLEITKKAPKVWVQKLM
ncbi:MAG: NAD-dependent epimerase/dehydratase family protein [Candidatus Aenigmarchaeota archaeon]|nr:NAD-dependent epimerase/dehydratase family protein [Candidatus Aenigmarchaeota archaeon]